MLLDRALSSSANTAGPSASPHRLRQLVPVAEELDPDLAVVCADRRLDPFRLASGLRERPRHRRLAHPVHAQDPVLRRLRAVRAPAAPPSSSNAACHRRRSSGGGPGRTTATAPSGLDDEARCRPCDPDHPPAVRALSPAFGRLPRTPRTDAGGARRSAARHARSPRELGSTDDGTAGGARQELDGPVVVSRPESAGDDEQVGRQALAKRRLQLLGLVSDERDPRGLEARASSAPRRETGRSRRGARPGRARCL